MKLIYYYIKNTILRTFFNIDLSNIEKEIAEASIKSKYATAVFYATISGILIIPAILFLDTGVLISVLIPITMVAGTAWFAISLANLKKKFENFGLELTTNMFESFVTSLLMLGLLTFFSLFSEFFLQITYLGDKYTSLKFAAAILGTYVVFRLLYNLFSGALKYDMNDAMLTGQNEVAERFFKKSLSLLHSSSENLRAGKGLETANYYIGLSFYEIFAFIRESGVLNGKLKDLMEQALNLKRNPGMSQKQADIIAINLIENFVRLSKYVQGKKAQKSLENIMDELQCLKINKHESQIIIDTRLSTIFEEIAELLELQGESLFRKR